MNSTHHTLGTTRNIEVSREWVERAQRERAAMVEVLKKLVDEAITSGSISLGLLEQATQVLTDAGVAAYEDITKRRI